MFCGCEELSIERKFVVPSAFQNLVIYTVFKSFDAIKFSHPLLERI